MDTESSAPVVEDHTQEIKAREQLGFMQKVFQLTLPDDVVPNKAELRTEVLKTIEEHSTLLSLIGIDG